MQESRVVACVGVDSSVHDTALTPPKRDETNIPAGGRYVSDFRLLRVSLERSRPRLGPVWRMVDLIFAPPSGVWDAHSGTLSFSLLSAV